MRGCLIIVALAFGLLPPVAAVGRKSARHRRSASTCPVRQPVLLSDGQAIIYRSGKGQPEEVFGCVPGHRLYDLGRLENLLTVPGRPAPDKRISPLAIGGPMVAYDDLSQERIVVRDLRTGRFVVREPHGVADLNGVEQLVVKDDGAVAWIARATFGWTGKPIVLNVYAVDASGARVLAIGEPEPIEPASLALAGSTLYWTQSEKPHSAPLN